MTAGVTFFLHVAFLLTIAAGDVRVPGPVGSGLPIEASLPAGFLGRNLLLQAQIAATCLISSSLRFSDPPLGGSALNAAIFWERL
jgi:hypothetical protein